ncbi:ATP-binding protein [Maricurvus nonylphenolicus]|uniref:sensor histidine kinase n=1 Tax=Maricurvus nonylphenolicus TaxID=1008307 RepID=UPI0036F25F6E
MPWPKKLRTQMVVLVLITLILAQGISLWVLSNAHSKALESHNQRFLFRQLSAIVQLLESTPPSLHENILSAWHRPGIHFQQLDSPSINKTDKEIEARLTERLTLWLGDEYRDRIRVAVEMKDKPPRRYKADKERYKEKHSHHRRPPLPLETLIIEVQLQDNRWLQSQVATPAVSPLAARQTLTFLLISSVLVLAVVIWRLRRITRSLSDLTQAASDLGRGQKVAALDAQGPEDIKTAINAFNHMSERLDRFVLERTRMLAALSHDLRTPITSMRLRLELMQASEERDKLLASLEDMQQMSEATLAFIRESGDTEATRQVDLTALLDSLCDDFIDLGAALTFDQSSTPDQPPILACRPVSLKRALRNLLENAVKYGESVNVNLSENPNGHIVIQIQDQGPGIPETELERVFEPFYRVESSRNRDTGGIGLGLSISRQVIVNHGGELRLKNTTAGLLVEIELPLK